MKQIIIFVALLLLIGTAAATPHQIPYCVEGLVWDDMGALEEGVSVTFVFEGQSHTVITSDDGSFVFPTMNFVGIKDGSEITVSCKYGVKTVRINYIYSHLSGLKMVHIGQYGVGVTFNEPSQSDAIAAFLALGLIAIPLGNGIYRLFKKKE